MLAAQSSPVGAIGLTATVLVTSIALVAGLAWASRRLLGLPVGAVRALIAGVLGFAATVLRSLATLEGTLSLLTPGVDIAAEARQYAADHVAEQLRPRCAEDRRR